MKRIASLFCLFLALFLGTTCLQPVLASENLNTLCVEYLHPDTNKPLEGVSFSLYKVADTNEQSIQYDDAFKNVPVDISLLESDTSKAVTALEAYVYEAQIEPLQSLESNEKGQAYFEGLEDGWYLVLGKSFSNETEYFSPSSALISLPSFDAYTKTSQNEAMISLKGDYSLIEKDDIATSRTVRKIWDDEGYESVRPVQIEVELFADGQKVDQVTLNQENNWSYTWSELSAYKEYILYEKEVSNYTFTLEQEGDVFVLSNTYKQPNTPGDSNIPSQSASDSPKTLNKPSIPLSGTLLYLIPPLLATGCFLILAGALVKRK
jgi:hypothetical protein